ncbi:MAG: hypothetical protein J3K34DRAFT_269319 [Monoraphidium minutum]|nr:MAG: hypothetical protein J3K34DRAFT_269319 [Monoraphidium minutum]
MSSDWEEAESMQAIPGPTARRRGRLLRQDGAARPVAAPLPAALRSRCRSRLDRPAPPTRAAKPRPTRGRRRRSEGLHLSLFHPYRALPPEGATLHPEEEACDPQERACKTPAHTYEARCGACSNTGWARGAGSASSGRRGNLHTCVVCHGLGYVRRTTARFCPDSPAHMTLARRRRRRQPHFRAPPPAHARRHARAAPAGGELSLSSRTPSLAALPG